MWYEILYRVLSIVNYIVLFIIAVPLALQFFEIVVSLFPNRKKAKPSEKLARVAFIIPAHNEADVIEGTVASLIKDLDYPREKFDVYVIADNCTDDTAALAQKAGAKVMVHNDPDPKHHMALYPLKDGTRFILDNDPEAELIIHLDADNHVNPEFAHKMNDAYQAGADFARPFEGGLNTPQNFFTRACSFFYAVDSAVASEARNTLNLAGHVNGSGATMSRRMLLETGGYDCETTSDDTEFSFKRILEGRKAVFVEDAVVYEDMPSSNKDTFARNKRIAKGAKALKPLFWKLLGKSFSMPSASCFETFLTYIWEYMSAAVFIWIPIYYIYFIIFAIFAMNGKIELSMFTPDYFRMSLIITGLVLLGLLILTLFLFGLGISLLITVRHYKKFGASKRRELLPMVFEWPLYLAYYSYTLTFGSFSKNGAWGAAKRNVKK